MPLGSAGVFHDSVAAVGVMEDATGVATPPGARIRINLKKI
jgi:hypothetical protein